MTSAKGAPRQNVVTVRFDEGETAQLDGVAARYGLSRSGVLRAGVSLLDGVEDRRLAPVPAYPSTDLVGLRMEVNQIGVNLNQIARRINSGEQGNDGELRSVIAEVKATLEVLK